MFVLSNLQVSLTNVLGTPIEGEIDVTFFATTYSIYGPYKLNKGPNTISINQTIPDGITSEFRIQVRNDQYAASIIRIRIFKPDDFAWDNPSADCSLNNGLLTIKLIMIRLKQAPLSFINKGLKKDVVSNPDSDVSQFLKPNGITEQEITQGIWNDPDLGQQRYWGLDSFDKTLIFRTIKNDSGIPIKDAKAIEWDRFFFDNHSIKPSDEGGFLWMEYGAVDNITKSYPRYLIALWVPKREGNKPVDFVVNFSHSASAWSLPGASFPYRNVYPYAITKVKGTPPGHPQAYVHFGLSYLFDAPSFAFHFVAQALASKKPVVIINPILPLDNTEKFGRPFTNQQGLFRLILEVKQFLYQEGYSEPGGIRFDEWQGSGGVVGMLQNPYVINPNFIKAVPLELKTGNIVVTAHSSGLQFITSLIQSSKLPHGMDFPFELWGANESEFAEHWKELWDLDLAHLGGMAVADYIDLVVTWYKRGNRVLRIYRSRHTNNGPDAFKKIGAIATLRKKESDGSAIAEYWHNTNEDISFLWMNDGYSSSNTPSPDLFRVFLKPSEPWWRFHQVPVIIGFGHASKLRASS